MNYIRNLVRVSGEESADGMDPCDTIDKLAERVQTANLLDDRRDAVKALKSLAKRYRLEVGSRAMDTLVDVIEKDRGSSSEIVSLSMDALSYVIGEDEDGPIGGDENGNDELGERFSEIYIKNSNHVSLILSLLEDYDPSIRRPALRFLTGLLRHCPHQLQDQLLQDPIATSRLTDLLQESREFIRNDAVLMMSELTRGNPHIQKLVAYENAFQILLDIVFSEGDSIIVEDCLCVVLNLLKNNPSNQQLFKEHSLIQRLAQLLKAQLHPEVDIDLGIPNGHMENDFSSRQPFLWTDQKVANVHLLFQVIRCLVAPSSSEKLVQAAQKVMKNCGLLEDLCSILFIDGIPVVVLTEGIMAAAEVIRGFPASQEFFGSVVSPGDAPKPAVLGLLLSLTNERQPFSLRCALLYCFQAYLYKNETGKNQIVRTLLPSSTESGELTAGHILCSGLLSSDPALVWFCCVALVHCLLDTPSLKEQLLRVQLATSLGEAPVSLLQQICSVLWQQGTRKPQVAAGILMLLGVWLKQCPVAVSHFLHREENVSYLTTQVGISGSDADEQQEAILQGLCAFLLGICLYYNDDSNEKRNRASLSQIYERRVGKDVMVEKLDGVSRSEFYVKAAQRTHPQGKSASDLMLDHEFTKIFKSLEGDLVKFLCPSNADGGSSVPNGPAALPHSVEQHESIVQSYKELIKRQDAQIGDLTQQVKRLHAEIEQEKENSRNVAKQQVPVIDNSEIDRLKEEVALKCRLLEEKDEQLRKADTGRESHDHTNHLLVGENQELRCQLEALNALLQQKQNETVNYQKYCNQWQAYYVSQTSDPNQVLGTMHSQFSEMEEQLGYGWQAFEQQSQQLAAITKEKVELAEKLKQMETEKEHLLQNQAQSSRIASQNDKEFYLKLENLISSKTECENALVECRETVNRKEEELATLKKEQDDLLVLLADQDQKIREYRRRLIHIGQSVSEDEEDEADTNEFLDEGLR